MLPFFKELCQAEPEESIFWKFETLRRDPFFTSMIMGGRVIPEPISLLQLHLSKYIPSHMPPEGYTP